MNRTAHKKLFHDFLYDRSVLTRLSDAVLDRGTIGDDDTEQQKLKALMAREQKWKEHLAFYVFLEEYYDVLRRHYKLVQEPEKKAQNPQEQTETRGKLIPLNRRVEKVLREKGVIVDNGVSSDGSAEREKPSEYMPSEDIRTLVDKTAQANRREPLSERREEKNIRRKIREEIPIGGNARTDNSSIDSVVEKHQNKQLTELVQRKPTTYLLEYAKDVGVGGEEKNILSVAFGILGGVNIMFISPSGSGKTVIIDACLGLFPEGMIYKMVSSTNAAEMRNFEEMNHARIGYIIEAKNYLTEGNDNDHYKMILCLAEGKDYPRKVTSPSINPETGDRRVLEFLLKANKSFITADAIESYLDLSEEMRRRFVELRTDTSEEHIGEVIRTVARNMSGLLKTKQALSSKEETALKSLIGEGMNLKYVEMINPFENTLHKIIPRKIRAISYTKNLFKMIYGSMLLHNHERITHDGKMYVEMQDVYNAMEVYFQQMCKSIIGYPVFGDEIMKVIYDYVARKQGGMEKRSETESSHEMQEPEKRQEIIASQVPDNFNLINPNDIYFTADNIYKMVKKLNGYSRMNIDTLGKILNELFVCECLEKNEDDYRAKNPSYRLPQSMPFIEVNYNWEQGFADAYQRLKSEEPKMAEIWKSKQMKDNQLVVFHPITGEEKILCSVECLNSGGINE